MRASLHKGAFMPCMAYYQPRMPLGGIRATGTLSSLFQPRRVRSHVHSAWGLEC